MSLVADYFRELFRASRDGWNRFWFTPSDPATLGLIRILAGAMLFYTHLIWSLDLESFFGPRGWVSPEALSHLPQRDYTWSYLFWIHSPAMLWTAHIAALVVFRIADARLLQPNNGRAGFLDYRQLRQSRRRRTLWLGRHQCAYWQCIWPSVRAGRRIPSIGCGLVGKPAVPFRSNFTPLPRSRFDCCKSTCA